MRKLLPIGLAALSGVLYFVGFIGFDQWYLEWVAFVPLLVALDGIQTGRRAFLLSWWMGFVTHLGGYYWVVHLLQTFAFLPLPLSVLGYLLLCLGQGALLAVFGWLAWKLNRRTGIAIGWTAPVALVATEFAFPLLFPSYTANSQAWVPLLIQVVDLGGVLLLSGFIALVSGAVAEVILARLHRRPLPRALPLAAAGALAFTLVYGWVRMGQNDAAERAAPTLKTAIIQANVGAGAKHEMAEAGIRRYRDMTDEAMRIPGLGLAVWPESGLNRLVMGKANLTGKVATEVKVPMLVGALRGEPNPEGGRARVWNSILAIAPGGETVAAYDKVQLLVFGEYLPGYETFPGFFRWLLKMKILPYLSVYERGTSFAPLPVGPWRLSADVCYEDILPRHIRDLMGPLDEAGTRPHAMFNGTNDSWYGPAEPPIHLALSVFRAVEHHRWLVRSTATGISAFIDSSGRLVQRSGFETEETLVRDVPMITGGATVYGLLGDMLGWLALAAATLGVLQRRLRPENTQAGRSREAGRRKAAAAA
ncbi:MAG: apolipoprotein N-acyltransferase [Deltaproteobacteria bacterium]|nr:apolipoprotein N-acyltransferase [Deltaproteobacteria bacterium]